MTYNKIIFLGNARDFHAMDWYRTIKKICPNREVSFATDLIDSEKHAKIVTGEDSLMDLYNVDWLLLNKQSLFGNVWRNFVKLCLFPVQVYKLKQIYKSNVNAVYHAHTMYYMFICWIAGIKFIGSPQGGEISIRPHKSRLYKYFAVKSLRAAKSVIVDSVSLQKGIMELAGVNAVIIQYGIDVSSILSIVNKSSTRTKIVSIRALYPLYRIDHIFESRDQSINRTPLYLYYPFWEDGYKEVILKKLQDKDVDMGRIPTKQEIYKLLGTTLLAVSIPEIDSSPRSVYEAIFCGCCVAITYNPWIENISECMKSRIVVVDLQDDHWLEKAIRHAEDVVKIPYEPSESALDIFDQERSMMAVSNQYYN